jgi:hypothetical protein
MAEMDIGMTHTTAANLMAVGKDGKTGRTGGQAPIEHPRPFVFRPLAALGVTTYSLRPAYPLTRLPAYPLTRLPAYPLTRLLPRCLRRRPHEEASKQKIHPLLVLRNARPNILEGNVPESQRIAAERGS